MAQDIREMFKKDRESQKNSLKEGHQKRFEARLEKEFPGEKESKSFFFLKIAAVLAVALGVGFFFLKPDEIHDNQPVVVEEIAKPEENEQKEKLPSEENKFQLSQVSPQFKKIEDYYMTSLNIELARININAENKVLIDSFMKQMAELDKEYERLNLEIKNTGIHEQTLEAMLANLQLRLNLITRLKRKLKELKQSKNENYEDHRI